MSIIFILLIFSIYLIYVIKYKKREIVKVQEEIVLQVRHQALLQFREYINEYLNNINEESLSELLIMKIKNDFSNLSDEELKNIIDSEYIAKLINAAKFN